MTDLFTVFIYCLLAAAGFVLVAFLIAPWAVFAAEKYFRWCEDVQRRARGRHAAAERDSSKEQK